MNYIPAAPLRPICHSSSRGSPIACEQSGVLTSRSDITLACSHGILEPAKPSVVYSTSRKFQDTTKKLNLCATTAAVDQVYIAQSGTMQEP